ncbi:DNA-directed RNA polymerase II subunit RPB2 [Camellia lanceoleosa]|uniref:DNA-directed RNA polymerase II subunit RPB2 n=1 Tax=Camellia lanceoleosa TaxID=1840588 RepID=A0ACC0I8E8_9ERIC|nr:DNA-directed RNA polymerase II subunit RPB2 [Camellia lanceoleosa]
MQTIYRISFGQIYLSKPMMTESDGEPASLFPKAARLRNLTYSYPLYVDVTKRVVKKGHDCEEVTETQEFTKVFIGKTSEKDLTELGECPFDQGGYFIINGSEKVLIAQEKMSTNHVYVFKKRQPNKYAFVAKVRSMAESQNRPPSSMFVRMLSTTSAKGGSSGQYIRATLPYIRTEIPIVVVFRALGFVADKDTLEHICYEFSDFQMMDLLRPSLEEAFVIQNQQLFRKLTRDVKSYVQKCVDNGKDVNLQFAIKAKSITSGLKYSLATGNWGQANAAGTRAGVSQVGSYLIHFILLDVLFFNSFMGSFMSTGEDLGKLKSFRASWKNSIGTVLSPLRPHLIAGLWITSFAAPSHSSIEIAEKRNPRDSISDLNK